MEDNKSRLLVFYGALMIGFLVLTGRLFELQIILGPQNRALAEGNRIRKVVNPAPRGMIYDRYNKPLVRNIPIYRAKEGEEKYRVVSREEALKIEAQGGEELKNLRMDIGRDYLYGQVLVHVLGYLGEANQKEVAGGDYQLSDLVGRMGVEEAYDLVLRGQDGGEIFEVDSQGNKIREVGRIEPIPGQDLYLSIDAELSRIAFKALEGKKGAVVATEARTGQVLVLVSSPSFDPGVFTQVSTDVHPGGVSKVLEDPDQPMFNRAIGGIYPPGSTFKIVTAAAGIEEGKVDETTVYEDTGEIRIGEYVYRNWYFSQYGKTEGKIDVVRAIKRSTDTFFYKIGEWVGANQLAAWAKAFGLGKESGIDIAGEIKGLVPDPEWKQKVKGERWFLGNTYHFAIGQADLLTTPLQVNMMTSVIANEGRLCRPQVLFTSVDECQDLNLKEKTLQLIKEGMKEACSEGGTAFPFFDFRVSTRKQGSGEQSEPGSYFEPRVACKTGTAEFGPSTSSGQVRTHAWLTAFAPADPPAGGPAIVVTALVEAGGEGADVAAPIVKKIMEAYFSQDSE